MSRIGKMTIPLPSGVTVDAAEDGLVTVKGPKGTLVKRLSPDMRVVQEDGHGGFRPG